MPRESTPSRPGVSHFDATDDRFLDAPIWARELDGRMARLERVIGRSPDDATKDGGSGMCLVLTELAQDLKARNRKVTAWAGAVGVFVAIAVQVASGLIWPHHSPEPPPIHLAP